MTVITDLFNAHPVVLFMKGTPERPFCGFSRAVVSLLNSLSVPFHPVDVLQDPCLREEIKTFSNWPTFPQLYVDQQLIGGCDIVREMYEAGELQTLLAPFQNVAETGAQSRN